MTECVTHHACDCIQQELDRLRRERDDARNQAEDVIGVEAADLQRELDTLQMKFTELAFENQKLCADVLSLEQQRDELEAERDRLSQITRDDARWMEELVAERDRYRAALERIARTEKPECLRIADVAREALNGGTDD